MRKKKKKTFKIAFSCCVPRLVHVTWCHWHI
uniref:Uncharacterized protein n=1 Tax=Rhizophora mucronata TaxID=61149 RepID=A0A2P2LID0_RHIMU